MTYTKKLPPYGKALASRLNGNDRPKNDVFLFLGTDAWKSADNFSKRGLAALALPLDESPEAYMWPVHNLDVLAILTSEIPAHLVKQTAYTLLLSGAYVVRVVLAWNGKMPAIYRRRA